MVLAPSLSFRNDSEFIDLGPTENDSSFSDPGSINGESEFVDLGPVSESSKSEFVDLGPVSESSKEEHPGWLTSMAGIGGRSAMGSFGEALKGISVGAKLLEREIPSEALYRLSQSDVTDQTPDLILPIGRLNKRLGRALIGGPEQPLTPEERAKIVPAEATRLYKAGEAVSKAADFIPVNPAVAESLPGKVAGFVGGVAPLIASGPAALPMMVSSGLAGGYEQARTAGATPEQADLAALTSGATSGAFAIPVSRVGQRLLGKVAQGGIGKVLKAGATEGTTFAGMTAGSQALNNAVAKATYAPARKIGEGVWDQSLVAGIGGGLIGAGGQAVGHLAQGRKGEPEVAPTGREASPPPDFVETPAGESELRAAVAGYGQPRPELPLLPEIQPQPLNRETRRQTVEQGLQGLPGEPAISEPFVNPVDAAIGKINQLAEDQGAYPTKKTVARAFSVSEVMAKQLLDTAFPNRADEPYQGPVKPVSAAEQRQTPQGRQEQPKAVPTIPRPDALRKAILERGRQQGQVLPQFQLPPETPVEAPGIAQAAEVAQTPPQGEIVDPTRPDQAILPVQEQPRAAIAPPEQPIQPVLPIQPKETPNANGQPSPERLPVGERSQGGPGVRGQNAQGGEVTGTRQETRPAAPPEQGADVAPQGNAQREVSPITGRPLDQVRAELDAARALAENPFNENGLRIPMKEVQKRKKKVAALEQELGQDVSRETPPKNSGQIITEKRGDYFAAKPLPPALSESRTPQRPMTGLTPESGGGQVKQPSDMTDAELGEVGKQAHAFNEETRRITRPLLDSTIKAKKKFHTTASERKMQEINNQRNVEWNSRFGEAIKEQERRHWQKVSLEGSVYRANAHYLTQFKGEPWADAALARMGEKPVAETSAHPAEPVPSASQKRRIVSWSQADSIVRNGQDQEGVWLLRPMARRYLTEKSVEVRGREKKIPAKWADRWLSSLGLNKRHETENGKRVYALSDLNKIPVARISTDMERVSIAAGVQGKKNYGARQERLNNEEANRQQALEEKAGPRPTENDAEGNPNPEYLLDLVEWKMRAKEPLISEEEARAFYSLYNDNGLEGGETLNTHSLNPGDKIIIGEHTFTVESNTESDLRAENAVPMRVPTGSEIQADRFIRKDSEGNVIEKKEPETPKQESTHPELGTGPVRGITTANKKGIAPVAPKLGQNRAPAILKGLWTMAPQGTKEGFRDIETGQTYYIETKGKTRNQVNNEVEKMVLRDRASTAAERQRTEAERKAEQERGSVVVKANDPVWERQANGKIVSVSFLEDVRSKDPRLRNILGKTYNGKTAGEQGDMVGGGAEAKTKVEPETDMFGGEPETLASARSREAAYPLDEPVTQEFVDRLKGATKTGAEIEISDQEQPRMTVGEAKHYPEGSVAGDAAREAVARGAADSEELPIKKRASINLKTGKITLFQGAMQSDAIHEIVHSAWASNRITHGEWGAIRRAYDNQESFAQDAAKFALGEKDFKTGPLKRAMQRVVSYIKNVLDRLGIRDLTVEDVWRRILRGEVGGRKEGTGQAFNPESADIRAAFGGERSLGNLPKDERAEKERNLTIAKGIYGDAKDVSSDEAQQIRLMTGWYRGDDGNWRYEIDDHKMQLTGKTEGRLDEVVKHDELFRLYPEIRDVKVSIHDGARIGKYDPWNLTVYVRGRNEADKRATMIHEIQHVLQHAEGWLTNENIVKGEEYPWRYRPHEIEAVQVAHRLDWNEERRKQSLPVRHIDLISLEPPFAAKIKSFGKEPLYRIIGGERNGDIIKENKRIEEGLPIGSGEDVRASAGEPVPGGGPKEILPDEGAPKEMTAQERADAEAEKAWREAQQRSVRYAKQYENEILAERDRSKAIADRSLADKRITAQKHAEEISKIEDRYQEQMEKQKSKGQQNLWNEKAKGAERVAAEKTKGQEKVGEVKEWARTRIGKEHEEGKKRNQDLRERFIKDRSGRDAIRLEILDRAKNLDEEARGKISVAVSLAAPNAKMTPLQFERAMTVFDEVQERVDMGHAQTQLRTAIGKIKNPTRLIAKAGDQIELKNGQIEVLSQDMYGDDPRAEDFKRVMKSTVKPEDNKVHMVKTIERDKLAAAFRPVHEKIAPMKDTGRVSGMKTLVDFLTTNKDAKQFNALAPEDMAILPHLDGKRFLTDARTGEKADVTAEELDLIGRAIRHLGWINKNMREMYVDGRKENRAESVAKSLVEIEKEGKGMLTVRGQQVEPGAFMQFLNAHIPAFVRFANMPTVKKIAIDDIRMGQDSAKLANAKARSALVDAFTEAGIKPHTREIENWLKNVETITLPSGRKIGMTRAELVTLTTEMSDPSTRELVSRTAYDEEGNEWARPLELEHNPAQSPAPSMLASDLLSLETLLTPGEKGLIPAFKKHNNDFISKDLWDTAYRIKGDVADFSPDHAPRHVVRGAKGEDQTKAILEPDEIMSQNFDNAGIIKKRVDTHHLPFRVMSFDRYWIDYFDAGNKIIHMAEPFNNMRSLLQDDFVKKALTRQFGSRYANVDVRNFLLDTLEANRHISSGFIERMADFMGKNFAGSILTLNKAVYLKNLISGSLALSGEFEKEDYDHGVKLMFDDGVKTRMTDNSGVAHDRFEERGHIGQYLLLLEGKSQPIADLTFREAVMAFQKDVAGGHLARALSRVRGQVDRIPWMQYFDSIPFRLAWAASEHMVDRTRPELTGKERMDAIRANFLSATMRTQNGTSSTEISPLASSWRQQPIKSWMLAFTSQANKMAAMLYEIAHTKTMSADQKQRRLMAVGAAIGTSYLIGQALALTPEAIGLLIAGRGPTDEEKDKAIRNGVTRAAGELFGPVYFGQDAAYWVQRVAQGMFDPKARYAGQSIMDSPPQQVIGDSMTAFTDTVYGLADTAQGKSWKRLGKGLSETAIATGHAMGIPGVDELRWAARIPKTAMVDSEGSDFKVLSTEYHSLKRQQGDPIQWRKMGSGERASTMRRLSELRRVGEADKQIAALRQQITAERKRPNPNKARMEYLDKRMIGIRDRAVQGLS